MLCDNVTYISDRQLRAFTKTLPNDARTGPLHAGTPGLRTATPSACMAMHDFRVRKYLMIISFPS